MKDMKILNFNEKYENQKKASEEKGREIEENQWKQDFPPIPELVHDRVLDTLYSLNKTTVVKHRFKKGRFVILVAALVLTMGITVTAAVNYVEQRMEKLNQAKIEEYFVQIASSGSEADNYNRHMTEQEDALYFELRTAYEKEGLFPEGELTILDEISDYSGKGIGFYPETSTFFLPDRELTQEELLQIIDFGFKRDYSLTSIHKNAIEDEAYAEEINALWEKTRAEAQEEIITTEETILNSDQVWEPDQELTIAYKGDVEIVSMTATADCIYLAGWDGIEKMEIGGETSSLFFDFQGLDVRVTDMSVASDNTLYVALWKMDAKGKSHTPEIWVINNQGVVVRKLDLSDYLKEPSINFVERMLVDDNGYLYIRPRIHDGNSMLVILDENGELLNKVESTKYSAHEAHDICIGKDNQIYTLLYSEDDTHTNLATIDPETGTLGEIYEDILPGDVPAFDYIKAGVNSDFIIWGYDGIYTYNLSDQEAVRIMAPYQSPCEWDGSQVTSLADGRIVIADATSGRLVTVNGNEQYRWDADSIYFYYVPTN